MNIGFAYDLKDDYLKAGYSKVQAAEFDSIETVNAVTDALRSLGHSVVPIGNVYALMKRLLAGERWDLVFNICEGVYGTGREALVPALLDAYSIPYTFSDPLIHAITLNKAVTKNLLKANGLATTKFIVVRTKEEIDNIEITFGYPLFVKAIGEGTGKGITFSSKVQDITALKEECGRLIGGFAQPVIVEPYLSGREVTVGVLGSGKEAFVCGVMEVSFTSEADSDFHSYSNKESCDIACIYTLINDEFAERCAELALCAHRALWLRDASRVDIRADSAGSPQIMEINSLPGLMPGHSDLIILAEKAGKTYNCVIEAIVNSALKR